VQFEWDEWNLRHILIDRPHGVTPALVLQVSNESFRLFANSMNEQRSGSHLMIGPDADGRFWTIVLLELTNERYRPITGWPSTSSEIRRYEGGD
jgi:uncharacterized DUF497 family protein